MVSSRTTADAKGQNSKNDFDKFSFLKAVKNIGRAYRKQAMELISLCRTFSQAREQTPDSDTKLRSAFEVVDKALRSAAGVTKKASEEVDQAFEQAIKELEDYETVCHLKCTVNEKMAAAKEKDIRSSTALDFLKGMFSPKPKPTKLEVVEFFLLKSLLDPSPIIVKQVLSHNSNLPEALWNFSRFKGKERLTLKQNPHFYKFRDIPETPRQYHDKFKVDPIENFQHAIRDAKICVITDKPGRIFIRAPQRARAFGNVWRVPHNNDNNPIIFKDVCGKLEGENIVHASISVPSDHLWDLEDIPSSPTSPPPVVSPSPRSNTATSSTTSSASDESFRDWREPIRRRLSESPELETSICIRASVGPSGNPSPPSSLTPPVGSGANDSSGNSITSQSGYIGPQRNPFTITWRVFDMGVPGKKRV